MLYSRCNVEVVTQPSFIMQESQVEMAIQGKFSAPKNQTKAPISPKLKFPRLYIQHPCKDASLR